jgi:hypothetical protein
MVCALVLTCLASCSLFKSDKNETDGYSDNRKIMEQEAQRKLQTARVFMQKEDFSQAKKTIEAMRKKDYLAITARKEGILLMDSICLQEAKMQLTKTDSLQQVGKASGTQLEEACQKVQFYERKLQFDKQR